MSERAVTPASPIDPRVALSEAAATGAACALRWASVSDGDIDRAARARSVSLDEAGFAIAISPVDAPALAALAASGGKLLATIRRGNVDVLFVTNVLDVGPRGQAELVARLAVPARLLASARRAAFRVDLSEADLAAIIPAVWRIEPGVPVRDRPKPSQALRCRLHDLSGGGGRMTLTPRQGGTLVAGQRLRIELTAGERTMRFDGKIRDVAASVAGWRCGVQFIEHAHDLDLRRDGEALHRLLADLQRRAASRRAA